MIISNLCPNCGWGTRARILRAGFKRPTPYKECENYRIDAGKAIQKNQRFLASILYFLPFPIVWVSSHELCKFRLVRIEPRQFPSAQTCYKKIPCWNATWRAFYRMHWCDTYQWFGSVIWSTMESANVTRWGFYCRKRSNDKFEEEKISKWLNGQHSAWEMAFKLWKKSSFCLRNGIWNLWENVAIVRGQEKYDNQQKLEIVR